MHTARDNSAIRAGTSPIPSRRGMLVGSTTALVAAVATIATSAGAAPPGRLPKFR
jgi:hypothetical protein